MSVRRDKLQIIYDILKSIQNKGDRIKPTHLLYKSNLSYNKMKDYVKDLKKRGLLTEEEDRGKRFYRLTDQGRKFIVDYDKIKEFSDSFGL